MTAFEPHAAAGEFRAFFERFPGPACVAALDGSSSIANDAWKSLFGPEVGWLLRTADPVLFSPDDQETVVEALASLDVDRQVEFEGRLTVAQGEERTYRFSVWMDLGRVYAAAHPRSEAQAVAVATVAHELRTPLTAVRGALSLLAGSALSPDDARLVQIAGANADRLARIVGDLLEVERLSLGVLKMNRQPVKLSTVLKDALDSTREYAREYDAQLSLAGELDVRVLGDPDRLVQVLTNLVSNACKHTPRGAGVDVRLALISPRARVEVRDRGPGVPEAFRPRLFQRFAQATRQDALRGVGLGLSIARSIVEAHGGVIGYEPASDGGSVFFFELPVLVDGP
jgi:signal transduction histidine kinase